MKNRKLISVCLVGVVLGALLVLFPAPADRMLNIQNYLITVGGIISAFVISYLSAKIFSIRNERENQQIEIDKYSEKLTNYRRLIYFVMKSRELWVHYDEIAVIMRKYPTLTYARLHAPVLDDEATTAWNDAEISAGTLDLYLAMRAIYGVPDYGIINAWPLDKAVEFQYTLDDITSYYEPSNTIWYYLDGKFAKHGKGHFREEAVDDFWKNQVMDVLPRIDPKYRNKDFDRLVLAEIGTAFYEYIIPKLFDLIKKNTGIPKIVTRTFYSLIAIMAFGVVLPIAVQSMSIDDGPNIFLTLLCVWLTILAIVLFLLDFLDFIHEDVHMVKPKGTP